MKKSEIIERTKFYIKMLLTFGSLFTVMGLLNFLSYFDSKLTDRGLYIMVGAFLAIFGLGCLLIALQKKMRLKRILPFTI